VRRIAALVVLAALLALTSLALGRAEASTPTPKPKTVTIDVMVDSHLGDTSAVIDCGPLGVHYTGADGDGTLILANVYAPAKVRCTLTLR